MEKSVKLTTTEIIKWLTFLFIIISAFVVNQMDIERLKDENHERKEENRILINKLQEQERITAGINQKLEIIYGDVTVIKNAILSDRFSGHGK